MRLIAAFMAFALLASPALAARGGVLPLSADDGWLQFGNFVVLLFASAALVSVCAYALRSLSRRPILFLVMFSVSSLVATIVADKTNGVNNLPPMPPRECKVESVKCKMGCAVIASTTLHSQLSTLHSFGALDFATIRVICDGPSDLGDHVIIARTNQVCHVPLLAGATYAVESDLPIAYSAVSSEHAHIVTNSITNLTVSLPLVFTVERIEMRGGGSDSYIVQTSPINVGPRVVDVSGVCCSCTTNETGFTWNCLPNCICGGSSHAISVFANWFGYSHPFTWWGRCHCYYEDQTAIDEIEGRGVGLEILDALGNAIEWKNPVLVGESVIVEATVGGSEMTVSGFADLFDGRIRLKAYYVDADGEHDIVGAAIPISAENVTSRGQNVFRVSVTAEWLQSTGIVRNAADGIASKTSIDMSAADAGESNRQDSDIFDAQMSGRLYGRARGGENGNEMAAIPEGCLNQKTFKAGGTGILRAMCGLGLSNKCQVQQQADMIFYSGHGGHESAMLVGNVHPSILNPHWTNINAVVLSGCAVLDIANYRQQSFGWKSSLRWRMHGGANSPGEVWESLDVGILLGFAWTAPLDDAGGGVPWSKAL